MFPGQTMRFAGVSYVDMFAGARRGGMTFSPGDLSFRDTDITFLPAPDSITHPDVSIAEHRPGGSIPQPSG